MSRALLLVVAVGCAKPTPTPTTTKATPVPAAGSAAQVPTKPAALVAPELRLPPIAKPLHNTVDLAIDPASEDFTGTIETKLDVLQATDVIWLNGLEIAIDHAKLDGGADLVVEQPAKNFIALKLPGKRAPGPATLTIQYRGKMHLNDGDGIYTVDEAGTRYAFTQFEATDARQAFPTFDEPSYKVPWQLTLHVKAGQVALANTPVEKETDEAGGGKAVRFAETKPLPSYLVAFAVGPFEFVDAGKTRAGAPIRIVVPKGRKADAAYAVEATAPLLALLEDYFGTPYPFPKLDMVSVPVFNAGAMENPGLITFRQEILLTKPSELTQGRQEEYAVVAAHEMAHQWFGDLVTLAWWDDTWLNESFASWMETKIVAKWKPAWDFDISMVEVKARAMGSDSLESARAIRQPISSTNDITTAFDDITYGKGEAVLRMVERHVGEDVFQRGVRAYLAKHAGGNATYPDFVGAISEAAGKDLSPLFDAFVKEPGVPTVAVETSCKTATIKQTRFKPIGSEIDEKKSWPLPVCVKWGVRKTTGRDCVVLDPAKESTTLELSAKACPEWVLPNDGELGYYHWSLGEAPMKQLLAHTKALTLPERIGVINDVEALVQSGKLSNGVALGLVAEQAKDKSRHVVGASIGIVAGIAELVPDKLRANYQRFITKVYLARAKELGWKARAGEGPDVKQLRPQLLGLVAGQGKNPALIAEATALAWKWLDDHKAVDPEVAGTVLHVAAKFGDQKLFDRIHAEAKKASSDERARFIGALGAFVDPKIVPQALALVLTDEFDIRESAGLMNFNDPSTRTIAFEFAKAHFDEISARLPPAFRAYMAYIVVAVCDDSKKAELEAFVKPKVEKLDGGPLVLAQAMEQLSLCAASRKAQAPGIEAFLAKQ